jgi:hypothetical protein
MGGHDRPARTGRPLYRRPPPTSRQLKEVAQLDGWLRDGSAAYLESLCDWGDN